MPSTAYTKLASEIFSNLNAVNMTDVERHLAETEQLSSLTPYGDRFYGSKAELDADLAHDAPAGAIVFADPVADNVGIYRKIGASGSGSWVQVIKGLPGYSFQIAGNAGAGTANAIVATTGLPISGAQLIALPIVATNTASPVTVSFNGGTALTIKTASSGINPAIGGLQSGMTVWGYVSGSNFQLISDQASAAIQAAAEAAQAASELARDEAETARDEAQAAATLANANVPALVLTPAGQSNDVDRAPQAVTSWPSKLKTFSGGSAMLVSGQTGYVNAMWARPETDFASLSDWTPNESGKGGYVPGFAQADERYGRIVAFGAAVGGRHWREMDPGEGAFANVSLAMWHGVRLLEASGYQPANIDVVIPWALGESDADATGPGGSISETGANKAQWQAVIAKAKDAYRRQWRYATGLQAAEIKLLASPMAIQDDDSSRYVNDAILAAAQGDSEIILAGPRYCFPHEADGIHMTGVGQYLRGYHEQLRLAQMRADDAKRLPLHVTAASWTGTTLTIDFNRECQIDTTTIAETTTSFSNSRYGIEIFDSGTPVAISSGSMTSATRFTGVTASAKSGTATGRIGQMTWPGGNQTTTLNSSANKMARTNFREPTALGSVTVLGTSYSLYNWACQQALPF